MHSPDQCSGIPPSSKAQNGVTLHQTDQSLTIMIVDDDARVRRALARCLELDGHLVEVAESGAGALALVGTRSWDLICLDAQLPDIQGPQLARQLHPNAASAYTVLVTGFASSFDDTGLLTECIDAVLPKPWKMEELETVIERVRQHAIARAAIRAA
ncbi:MAG: response regulator [Chloroflexota bacterium]